MLVTMDVKMQLFSELLPASFRGVPFMMDSHSTTGGRKTVTHEFPNSDNRTVEDMGLLNKSVRMQAVISGANYRQRRDSLVFALEKQGSGILSHPFLGNLNVVAKPYTLNESISSLGEAIFELEFEIIKPQQSSPVSASITGQGIYSAANLAKETVKTDLLQSLTYTHSSNIIVTIKELKKMQAETRELIKKMVLNRNNPIQLIKILDKLVPMPKFINDGVAIYDSIEGMFKDLVATISSPFNAFIALYSYYNFGTPLLLNFKTAELNERRNNESKLSSAVQTMAWIHASTMIPEIPFSSTNEIDSVAKNINDQYEAIMDSEAIQKIDRSNVVSLRNETRKYLDLQKITAYKIKGFHTQDTTITELAYRLYGNIDNVDTLLNLNNIKSASFISGDIKVLTK